MRSYGSIIAEVRDLQLSGLHAANPCKQNVSCSSLEIIMLMTFSSKVQNGLDFVCNFLQNSDS